MRLGIKGKQVLGVTSLVAVVVVGISILHLSTLARVLLEESRARAELLANAIYHRAREVVDNGDLVKALRDDSGLRSILESSYYSKHLIFAAIADVDGVAIVHVDRSLEGRPLAEGNDLSRLLERPPLVQLFTIYTSQGQTLVLKHPLLRSNSEFGSIRIGVSTLLIRDDLIKWLGAATATAIVALGIAVGVAMLLAQLLLKPIHVIRSGLTRLGAGEFGVRLDLNQQDEFGELGNFFNAVSAQLSADRTQMAGQVAHLESAVEHLEDAVAIVNARDELLFLNPAMRALLPDGAVGTPLKAALAADHPAHKLIEQTLFSRQSRGPVSLHWGKTEDGEPIEHLVMTHAINAPAGDLVGIMLIARNLEYLSQVQSTIRYSRKLAALGRLSAGVAHEVKNPLNAMMIHLELLRQQLLPRAAMAGVASARAGIATVEAPPAQPPEALKHVEVIASEIKRLDEVVQGFLKFTRSEDLKLQPVQLPALFEEIVPIIRPEAERASIELTVECGNAPDVNGDVAMLRQAFLNLALNACQAMPQGGTLRIRCQSARDHRVKIEITDSGVGIEPEHLQRIFDLYFTTKEKGSGIGLSMVYRTVQMHDGEIEVQSTPGAGTTFRVLLPQA